jgi:hypothetical protein
MSKTVKTNFGLLPETVRRMERLMKKTHHKQGDLVDWLVEEEMVRQFGTADPVLQPANVSTETVETIPCPEN